MPQARPETAPRRAADKPAAGSPQSPQPPLDASRLVMSTSLQAAQRAASWLEQWQLYETQAMRDWLSAISTALRDLEEAGDAQAIASVPARLALRQCDLATRRAGEACMQLFDAELQWLAQAREQSRHAATRAAPFQTGQPFQPFQPFQAFRPFDLFKPVAHPEQAPH